jgi:hypothetical protein
MGDQGDFAAQPSLGAAEQDRILAAVPDLARAGALESLSEALDRITGAARDIGRRREPGWRARLERLRQRSEVLTQSLSAEQRRVMQDIAEVQSRIQQGQKYLGTAAEAPAVDWRG